MSLNHALETLHRSLSCRWREVPESAGGLSLSAFEYLRAVESFGGACAAETDSAAPDPARVSEVAASLSVNRASASAMLERLARRGLVAFRACRNDARVRHVVLTEAGAAAIKESAALYTRSARTLVKRLSADEAKTLRRLLEKACHDA